VKHGSETIPGKRSGLALRACKRNEGGRITLTLYFKQSEERGNRITGQSFPREEERDRKFAQMVFISMSTHKKVV
jgi:hypothetical protein